MSATCEPGCLSCRIQARRERRACRAADVAAVRTLRRIAAASSGTPLFMFDPCHIDPDLYARPSVAPRFIGDEPHVVVQRQTYVAALDGALAGHLYAARERARSVS